MKRFHLKQFYGMIVREYIESYPGLHSLSQLIFDGIGLSEEEFNLGIEYLTDIGFFGYTGERKLHD